MGLVNPDTFSIEFSNIAQLIYLVQRHRYPKVLTGKICDNWLNGKAI
jgi:hypothetical protein